MFWLSLLILVVTVSLGEGFLHYIPWRLILNGENLKPPWTYVLGTGTIVVPLTVWMVYWQFDLAVIAVWVAVSAAGVTVLALYLFDYVLGLVWHKKESIERERIHGKEG